MRTRSRILTIAATAVALVLAACGGSEDTSSDLDDTAEDGESATADERADDPDADDDADDVGDSAAAEDGSGDDPDASTDGDDDLLTGVTFTSEPLKVEYSIESDQQGMPASLTIARDGTRVATYTLVAASGQTIETAVFIDGGEGVAFCFKESGGWSCFEQSDMPDQMGGMPDDMIEDTTIEDGELADHLDDAYRTEIADRQAICGTSTGTGFAEAGGEICVDASTGMLLRLDLGAVAGESLIMEAVSVTAASEEDFTPPAEPGSFGG